MWCARFLHVPPGVLDHRCGRHVWFLGLHVLVLTLCVLVHMFDVAMLLCRMLVHECMCEPAALACERRWCASGNDAAGARAGAGAGGKDGAGAPS